MENNRTTTATSFEAVSKKRKRSQQALSEALANFDRLPDSAHVRLPVVAALRGCSSATVWRHVKAGLIPAPHKLSPQISGWNVGELRQSLAKLGAQ